MLSVRGSAHFDEYFVSCINDGEYLTVCELSLLNKIMMRRKWHFCYRMLLCLTLLHNAFGKACEFCWL